MEKLTVTITLHGIPADEYEDIISDIDSDIQSMASETPGMSVDIGIAEPDY